MPESTAYSGRKTNRLSRPQIVLGALGCATLGLTSLLWSLDGRPAPKLQSPASAALVAVESSTSAVDIEIDQGVAARPWRGIVIHHSGSRFDTPESIETRHHEANLASIGYHIVIGNGSGMDDGEIFASQRWKLQQPGAHTGGVNAEQYNRNAIGICVVGDGERDQFSARQIERLIAVVAELQARHGISDEAVVLHREVARTASPGRWFPAADFRARLAGMP